MNKELIIFIGLQAAGKSTFYRSRFAETHVYVSKDRLSNVKRRDLRQRQLIEEALQADRSVVVDNTNVACADREPLIALGRQYDARVIGYYFAVEVSKSIERNNQRTGKERVPPVAIFTALKRLTRPSYKEGFAALYYVRANDDFTFAVSDWIEEEVSHE